MPQAKGFTLSQNPARNFAIVPAAGHSRRMGEPKLLLPWSTEDARVGSIIDAVLSAWTQSRVNEVVVVVRADDRQLGDACGRWPVRVLAPSEPPIDMKASVQLALSSLAEAQQPTTSDSCLIAPADIPGLSSEAIDLLIEAKLSHAAADSSLSIFVPYFGQQRGHPILLPWPVAQTITQLGPDLGVNALLDQFPVVKVAMPSQYATGDVDTPEEYQRRLREQGK